MPSVITPRLALGSTNAVRVAFVSFNDNATTHSGLTSNADDVMLGIESVINMDSTGFTNIAAPAGGLMLLLLMICQHRERYSGRGKKCEILGSIRK